MGVCEKIREIRKSKKMSQEELGKLLGVSQAMIAQYENGTRIPKIETIQKIAKALNVKYTNLLDMESIEKEMDFFELYTSYLKNIGYSIKLYSNSKNLIYRIEYDNEYVELSYDEFSSLSHDTVQHILSKLDELIQSKTTYRLTAAHNPEVPEEAPEDSDGSNGTDN